MNEQQLLKLGFKKEPFENEKDNYFLSFTLLRYQRGIDELELLWQKGDDFCLLFPNDIKIKGYNNIKKLVEAFKDINEE